jgi:hypothetical protein
LTKVALRGDLKSIDWKANNCFEKEFPQALGDGIRRMGEKGGGLERVGLQNYSD